MKRKIIKLCSRICLFFMDQNSDSANIVQESTILRFKIRLWVSGRNLGVGLDNIYKNNTIMNKLDELLKDVGQSTTNIAFPSTNLTTNGPRITMGNLFCWNNIIILECLRT